MPSKEMKHITYKGIKIIIISETYIGKSEGSRLTYLKVLKKEKILLNQNPTCKKNIIQKWKLNKGSFRQSGEN